MSEDRPKLHIASAQDLFEALDSPLEGVRLSVLQAIGSYREQALSFGPWKGEDLIGRLISQARSDGSPLVREAIVKVVAGYKSARVLAFLQERMQAMTDAQLIFELEPRFGVEPVEAIRDLFLGFLDDPVGYQAQALVASHLLAWDEALSTAQRLRVALLSDREAPVPVLDADSVDAWVGELNGPIAERAWRQAVEQGVAVMRLWPCWEALSDEARRWLLEWTAMASPETARAAVPALLGDDLSAASCVALLHCAATVGVSGDAFAPEVVTAMLTHAEPAVRAAALAAGLGSAAELLARMTDTAQGVEVRMAAIRQCVRQSAEGSLDALVLQLADADWRIRSAAAEALISLGGAVVERVQPLLTGPSMPARAAAARVLASLLGDDWLEQTLRDECRDSSPEPQPDSTTATRTVA